MQTAPNVVSPYFLFLFPVLFITVWALSSIVIGLFSGRHSLSRHFRAQSAPYGDTRSAGPFFYTVYMRFWGHYNSVIRLTATSDALYASVLSLFRIGHPPLSIPWNEIKFGRTKYLWRRCVVLTLGEQERIPMRISERMARKLGIMERVPGGDSVEIKPNFDTLSERFSDPSGRKPN